MTSRRAQRRAAAAALTVPLRLTAQHGRIRFVYDVERRAAVRVIGEHEQVDPIRVAFGDDVGESIAVIPGLSHPEQVLAWASDAPEQIPDHIGGRVLVTAVCEHIREEEAALCGWADRPELRALFDAYPTHWLVYAAMPTSRPPEESPA